MLGDECQGMSVSGRSDFLQVQRLFLEEKLKPLPNESAVTTLGDMGAYEGEKEG